MREDQRQSDEADRPESMFRRLRDRPTPEVDVTSAWVRLQARLDEQPGGVLTAARSVWNGWWARPVARWALAAATVAVVATGLWVVTPGSPGEPSPAMPSDSDLVLLADALPPVRGEPLDAADVGRAEGGPVYALDIRVVRGFDGPRPSDALPLASAGAGGADPLSDISPMLSAVVGPPAHALVGAWRGIVEDGAASTMVSERFELRYVADRTDAGLRLRNVELIGEGQPWIADEIVLEPGRSYVFGAGRAAADTGVADLVLAIRLSDVSADPVDAPDR